MEIVGLGSEVIECVRIRTLLERHGEVFLDRVFSPREVSECQSRTHSTEHFAARWAAKEAVGKALGITRAWPDVEVRADVDGRPRVVLHGAIKDRADALQVAEVLLTMAHCRAYATATALAVRAS